MKGDDKNDKTKDNKKGITFKCIVVSIMYFNANWYDICMVYRFCNKRKQRH